MLTLGDICKRLELTRGQANHYVVTGLVSVPGAQTGTGHSRYFSRINLLEFALVKKLIAHGFGYTEARELMRLLREEWQPLKDEALQRHGKRSTGQRRPAAVLETTGTA